MIDTKKMDDFLKTKRIFVFLGRSGSGKTENALSFAENCAHQAGKIVRFFDIDQTKQMFRAREAQWDSSKIKFELTPEFGDCPLIAEGLSGALQGTDICVIDVGGDTVGSVMAGQFSEILNKEFVQIFYVINPYRSFCNTKEQIVQQMQRTLDAAGLKHADILCNPNFGVGTTAEDILQGYQKLDKLLLPDYQISAISVVDRFWEDIEIEKISKLPLRIHTRYGCGIA